MTKLVGLSGWRVMFKKVDCVLFRVPNLEKALKFYRDALGHKLVWRRGNSAAGLAMSDSDTEIVLMAESGTMEVDLLVSSVETAVDDFVKAGGKIVSGPFDVQVGRCAVVKDPWGNVLTMLDTSKGLLRVDSKGNVLD